MPRIVILVLLTLACLAGDLQAQSPDPVLPEPTDVRIIVDISGSMKKNDPDNLRRSAVRLLAGMLPEQTSAGLWTFGQYVNMLVPHRSVSDNWRQTMITRSGQINSVALRTNLGKAIEVAGDEGGRDDRLDNTHFIILSDGKVDISDSPELNQQEEQRILQRVVPQLVARGAKFHPIALSAQADAEFLKQLADASGGHFQVADSARALNLAFLEALNAAAPQEQIPIEGNSFVVDSGVSEFTALIFRDREGSDAQAPLELVTPEGNSVTASDLPATIRWASEPGYDLVTVTDPVAGRWELRGEPGEGSRVTVVSDLRMVVSPVPSAFDEASPVDLRIAFFENDEKIINPDFLGVIGVEVTITSGDGRSGTKTLSADQPPDDGVYSDMITRLPEPGAYRIDVLADGKTFARKVSFNTEYIVPEALAEATPVMPEPEPEPVVPVAGPIDISQVETPMPVTAAEPPPEEPEPASSFAGWWLVAGASTLGVIVLALVWLLLKKRKAQKLADEEPVDEAEQGILAELNRELEEQMASEVPEPEAIPEVTEAVAPDDEDTAGQGGPESEKEAPEEEFGLEDFDLSEFEDIPDVEDSSLPDDKPDVKPDDQEKKK